MSADSDNAMLQLSELVTGYGKKQVLNGVGLSVPRGEIVALIGHNGAGKSTLLKAVFGLIPIWSGQVQLEGAVLSAPNPRDWLRRGVVYQPQGNRVFTDLTVRENLEIAAMTMPKSDAKVAVARALESSPGLKERLKQSAGTLSGGEKQMLALANALITSPRVLLLDEPSLGLSPTVMTEAFGTIQEISRDRGVAVVIVEQKVREVLRIASRVCVLRNGKVSFCGMAEELRDERRLKEVYL